MSGPADSIGFAGEQAASFGDSFSCAKRSLGAWLFERIRHRPHGQPRLEVIERITLAPRQILSLIEADGQKFLVATSPEGKPAFYPLVTGVGPFNRNRSGKETVQEEQR